MATPLDTLTGETVELLQALIRNECVNEGTVESGHEVRNADLLRSIVELPGVAFDSIETEPGRVSVVARREGTDPNAPALCLMGHTDVVPVSPDGWDVDPFGGELITSADGIPEVWGRGAVDMLNLTASMAVVFRDVVRSGKRYPGDLVFFAVADEEAGGGHGASRIVADHWDTVRCDYVLTEYGGTPTPDGSIVLLTVAEKGGSPRRLIVHGEPGHGSMPYRANSALIKAAAIVGRLSEYDAGPRLSEMFAARVRALGLPEETRERLLDPARIDDALAELPAPLARNLHSCSHTSFSPNILTGGTKANTIPDRAEIVVDIRLVHGDSPGDVDEHLRQAIGADLMASVDIEPYYPDIERFALDPSASPTDTSLWEALRGAVAAAYPGAEVLPSMVTGGTDARYFRRRGVTAYGAGLLSRQVTMEEFLNRFHGHNERIDVDSLRLTTALWGDVLDRLWG